MQAIFSAVNSCVWKQDCRIFRVDASSTSTAHAKGESSGDPFTDLLFLSLKDEEFCLRGLSGSRNTFSNRVSLRTNFKDFIFQKFDACKKLNLV